MRKKINLFLIVLCIFSFPLLVGFSPKNYITVATWNICHGNDAISSQKCQLLHMRADVVALQEVDEKTNRVNGISCLDTLASGTYHFKSFGKEINFNCGQFGLGILSRDYISNTKTVFREDGSIEKDGLMKTSILKDGKTISVYNVHLSYEYDWVRSRQINLAFNVFANDPNKYKIIMGDFNVEDLKELDIFSRFNMLSNPVNPLETYKKDDWSTKCLDNIIYSKSLLLTDFEMVESEFSDHNALVAKFRML